MNFASPGLLRGVLWDVLEASRVCFGLSWAVLELGWAGLELSWAVLVLSWGVLEAGAWVLEPRAWGWDWRLGARNSEDVARGG